MRQGDEVSDVETTGVTRMLQNVLQGTGSYANVSHILEGLDGELAGTTIAGAPHTIWQILKHLIYWQDFCLQLLHGDDAVAPEHASDSWPGTVSPTGPREWGDTVDEFLSGTQEAMEAASIDLELEVPFRPGRSRAEVLGMLMGHNSYHLGQMVLLRQMLGSWPPPSGGDTW